MIINVEKSKCNGCKMQQLCKFKNDLNKLKDHINIELELDNNFKIIIECNYFQSTREEVSKCQK